MSTGAASMPHGLLDELRQARHVAVFSGAGMSADSGIPTFRGDRTGLWATFDPQTLASPHGWANDRELVWAWYEWRRGQIMRAQPNAGHRAVAALERHCRVSVVTQNVDDLHERAGSADVVHLHGSLFAPRCAGCRGPASFDGDPVDPPMLRLAPPRCARCRGHVRPGVVWFGERLPSAAWEAATRTVADCDLLIVVGTSGVVQPAAGLPALAQQLGKRVAEINPALSGVSQYAALRWEVAAAEGLEALVRQLEERNT